MQRGRTFQDPSITNFLFIITPIEAHFSRPTQYKRTLTLQKGMQTLGTLDQCLPVIVKEGKKQMKHKFHPEQHAITFRIINDKNLNYHWTVYNLLDTGELEDIDSMTFSILSFWKNYVAEYQKNIATLLLKTKDDKDPKKLMETWKQLLGQTTSKTDHIKLLFPKSQFRLDFQIQAKSTLDKQLQQYQTQKVLKKLRETQRSQIRRSAITMANMPQQDFTTDEIRIIQKIRRIRTQQGDKLNTKMLTPINNRNYFLPIKQRNEPIKKIPSHNQTGTQTKLSPKARFTDQVQHSLGIISDLKHSVKKSTTLERHQSLKDLDRQENLQLSSKIKHEKVRTAMIVNTKKEQTPFDTVKVIVIYVVLGVIMLWLMYNLMGHNSKVEYAN